MVASTASPPLAEWDKLCVFTYMSTVPDAPDHDITRLLAECRNGDPDAESRLLELVYNELRAMARNHMRRESAGHTLQTTALVNEAYIRLFGNKIDWQDRTHFFAVAAQMMRRILVDHARARSAGKRSGGTRVELDNISLVPTHQIENLIALDSALEHLAKHDPRQAKLVELRFFAGLTLQESAEILGISSRTAKRDWAFAQAWLFKEIGNSIQEPEL